MTIIDNTCDKNESAEGWDAGEAWDEHALCAAVDDLVDRLRRFALEFEPMLDPELRLGIWAATASVRVVTIGRR